MPSIAGDCEWLRLFLRSLKAYLPTLSSDFTGTITIRINFHRGTMASIVTTPEFREEVNVTIRI